MIVNSYCLDVQARSSLHMMCLYTLLLQFFADLLTFLSYPTFQINVL